MDEFVVEKELDKVEENSKNDILKENTDFESNDELEDSTENLKQEEQNDVSEKIEIDDSNMTNCLALTIKEEYKLVKIKNIFIHSLKITWRVMVSTIALNILKIFLK